MKSADYKFKLMKAVAVEGKKFVDVPRSNLPPTVSWNTVPEVARALRDELGRLERISMDVGGIRYEGEFGGWTVEYGTPRRDQRTNWAALSTRN